jgi:fumarate hydratase class II
LSYQKIYNVALTGEIARMGPTHLMRAMNLFMGLTVDADRTLVRTNQLRIEAIDKQIADLKADGGIWSYTEITKLPKQRKELAGDIEQRTEESMAEGRSEVIKQGGDAQAVDAAMQSRARLRCSET